MPIESESAKKDLILSAEQKDPGHPIETFHTHFILSPIVPQCVCDLST